MFAYRGLIKNDTLLQFFQANLTACHADKGCHGKQFF